MIKKEINVHVCDFCAKTQFEVKKIVAGPSHPSFGPICICDECVDLAVDIIDEETEGPKLRLDAERYRALRAVSITSLSHVRVIVSIKHEDKPQVATADVVDEAVDLLLAKQREKANGL